MAKKNPSKNLLIGGPSTGKSSVLDALSKKGYSCFPEISREVTLEARELGIEHLFLEAPLTFSEMLLKGRIKQYQDSNITQSSQVFIDRGIPDISAYMDYFKQDYPKDFLEANLRFNYDKVFLFPIWNEIYTSDSERFEDLELAKGLQATLVHTYEALGYQLIKVPKTGVEERVDFILKTLET